MSDLKYAFRSILRHLGFSAFIVLLLAFGIGANATIFGIVDGILFRPLPVYHPDQLVNVFSTDSHTPTGFLSSYSLYLLYRDQAASFSSLAAYSNRPLNLSITGQRATRITGAIVTGNYFGTLGVRPFRGRVFDLQDDQLPAMSPVAVISERLWRTVFGGSPSVVGETIRLNNYPFIVIGIAPNPFLGMDLASETDVWVPMSMVTVAEPIAGRQLMAPNLTWLNIVGRLWNSVTPAKAEAELRTIAERRGSEGSEADPTFGATVVAVGHGAKSQVEHTSWLVTVVVLLVLLIVAIDVSSLFLARVEIRRQEFAIRLTLGAPRRNIITLLLFEAVILSFLGAVLGTILAAFLTALTVRWNGARLLFPGPTPSLLHWRVLLATALVSSLAAAIIAIWPAWHITLSDPISSLKGESPSLHGVRFSIRNMFVMIQIAVGVLLLLDAGTLLRTLRNDLAIDLGFQAERGIVAGVDLVRQGYDPARSVQFFQLVKSLAADEPGVKFAAVANSVPLQNTMTTRIVVDGENTASVNFNMLSPDYFNALGIRLAAGRDFDSSDQQISPAVGIVNETFAERFWPRESAIGKYLARVGPADTRVQVVGVVRDVRTQQFRQDVRPMLYVPVSQFYTIFPFQAPMVIVVRSDHDSTALSALFHIVGQIDKDVPLFNVRTFRDLRSSGVAGERALTSFLLMFAVVALTIAGTGLYGLVAFVTQSRSREFGIRLALGASSTHILGLVFRQCIKLVLGGLLLGLTAAFFSWQFISAFLFGVSPADPGSICLVAFACLLLSLFAALGPARRAVRVDAINKLLQNP